MDFEIYSEVVSLVMSRGPGVAAANLERHLAQQSSPFAAGASSRFSNSPSAVAEWLNHVYRLLAGKATLNFVYVEMNAFNINTDRWFCEAFGYSRHVDVTNLNSLSEWNAELGHDEALILTGMEAMQRAFAALTEGRFASDSNSILADLLVQCRFLSLMQEAVILTDLPTVGAATHDSDLVVQLSEERANGSPPGTKGNR